MSPDAYRAAEAIEFIAEHLRNEDQYIQVSLRTLIVGVKGETLLTIKSVAKRECSEKIE